MRTIRAHEFLAMTGVLSVLKGIWVSASMTVAGTASPIYVNHLATGSGDGTSWNDAFVDLQDALAFAANGDEIWVAVGTHRPDRGIGIQPGDRNASFQVPYGVRVRGGFLGMESRPEQRPGPSQRTTLSGDLNGDDGAPFTNRGDNSFHVVSMELAGDQGLLERLSIRGGDAVGSPRGEWAGGLRLIVSSPRIRDCEIRDNAGERGGGIFSLAGTIVLEDTAVQGNQAEDGAGWYSVGSNSVVTGCVFESNVADDEGGGARLEAGTHRFDQCLFLSNVAGDAGAIEAVGFNSVEITRTRLEANRGGAVRSQYEVILRNCEILSNDASTARGAVFGTGVSRFTIQGCKFEENREGALVAEGEALFLEDSSFLLNLDTSGTGPVQIGVQEGYVARTSFERNVSLLGDGGAVFLRRQIPFVDCVFRQNIASRHGGAFYSMTFLTRSVFSNCVFVGNVAAGGNGGALYVDNSFDVSNCTLVGNLARQGAGGAIFSTFPGMIYNNILWGNEDLDGSLESSQLTHFTGGGEPPRYCCIQGLDAYSGNGNIGQDPRFVDAYGADGILGTSDDDLRLLGESPCIDAGDNGLVLGDLADVDGDGDIQEPAPRDFRQLPRFSDILLVPDVGVSGSGFLEVVDLGAFESQDCNQNGLVDADEILMNMRNDCDANGVIDDCEILSGTAQDCNQNWIPDCCDLAAGRSEDRSPKNGVPDECESMERGQSLREAK